VDTSFMQTPVGPWNAGHLVWAGAALVGAVLARLVVVYLVGRKLRQIAARTETQADDAIIYALIGPLGMLILATGAYVAFRILASIQPGILDEGLKAFAIACALIVAWSAFRFVDAGFIALQESAQRRGTRFDEQLSPLLRKTAKIFIGIMAILVALQNLGYSISGLLAGLGIGGLAFALAAKDTIANLFGSVTILLDRPFRIGDWISADNIDGTVEAIGLRSTRVRTFDKTVVTIPNQALANVTVENHALMPRRRVNMTLRVSYATATVQLREAVAQLEALLRAHPRVDPEGLQVKFTGFGESSLEVLINYFTVPTAYPEHIAIRQELNLGIMETLEKAGVRFAFPTRTVHLEERKAEN
jgi:MscS family membrane protein